MSGVSSVTEKMWDAWIIAELGMMSISRGLAFVWCVDETVLCFENVVRKEKERKWSFSIY